MKITVKIKSVYGRELIYPACETSRKLCEMLNKKTLSTDDLTKLQEIGITIKYELGGQHVLFDRQG